MKVKGICPIPALWLISAISIDPMDNQLEEADVLQLPAEHITAPKGSFPTGEAMPKETGCGAEAGLFTRGTSRLGLGSQEALWDYFSWLS